MPYANWSEDLEAFSWQQMMEIGVFRTLLSTLKGIQFALQSQRTQGLEALAGAALVHAVFSETSRFPRGIAYIPVQHADWPNKFEQIRSALNYKTPDVAQTNKDLASTATNFQSSSTQGSRMQKTASSEDEGSKCITNQDERNRLEKALKAFSTGIADMENQLRTSILTQKTFEARFGAHWS